MSPAGYDNTVRVWKMGLAAAGVPGIAPQLVGRHEKHVLAVAFSADGSLLASASDDSTVKIWSTGDWLELLCMTGHADSVFSCSFSPAALQLVSCSGDHSVKIWSTVNGSCSKTVTKQSLQRIRDGADEGALAGSIGSTVRCHLLLCDVLVVWCW